MNDKAITIYNHHRSTDRTDSWQRTVLYGVEYSYNLEKTVTGDGKIVLTEMLTVVIPVDAVSNRDYIEYPKYKKLLDTSDYWTICPEGNRDVIVCGYCEDEITEEYKITDLKNDYLKSGTVAGFSDNTDGRFLKHYKVVCR